MTRWLAEIGSSLTRESGIVSVTFHLAGVPMPALIPVVGNNT